MIAQQEALQAHDYLNHPHLHSFVISHRQFPHDVSCVQGNIHPNLFPLLIAYLQFQMSEVQEGITLFPGDIKTILINLYGFEESTPERETEIELTDIEGQYKGLGRGTLLMPFYRQGLYRELKNVVEGILEHYNGESSLIMFGMEQDCQDIEKV